MVYSQKRVVGVSLCGTGATLSVPGMLMLAQDSLTELTGKLKIDGLTARSKYKAILVFARNHVKVFGKAAWGEQITVESFVAYKKLASYAVDTCIYGQDGALVACSRIELCGVDMQTGRLRKITTLGVDDTVVAEPARCDIKYFDRSERAPTFAGSVTVRTSNLDYVHHTNNVEYIKFLMNTLSADEAEQLSVSEMEIAYSGQSYAGDVLDIYSQPSPGELYYEIKHAGSVILKCTMLLSE